MALVPVSCCEKRMPRKKYLCNASVGVTDGTDLTASAMPVSAVIDKL